MALRLEIRPNDFAIIAGCEPLSDVPANEAGRAAN